MNTSCFINVKLADAINEDGTIKTELMEETISEPFRIYQDNPEMLKSHEDILELIESAIK